jgi:hypothetical protein
MPPDCLQTKAGGAVGTVVIGRGSGSATFARAAFEAAVSTGRLAAFLTARDAERAERAFWRIAVPARRFAARTVLRAERVARRVALRALRTVCRRLRPLERATRRPPRRTDRFTRRTLRRARTALRATFAFARLTLRFAVRRTRRAAERRRTPLPDFLRAAMWILQKS